MIARKEIQVLSYEKSLYKDKMNVIDTNFTRAELEASRDNSNNTILL